MINYKIRSNPIGNVVLEIKRRGIIISPYFQRDFVWRTIHKIDFIDTIIKNYPFPQIFLAKGDIDIESLKVTLYVVDGQQRLSAILDYLEGKFPVNGKHYKELTEEEKRSFLNYEVPIIELDIKHDDKRIIDIFKRLNRTFYSLSNIEKLATEYASSEFMLVAKLTAGDMHKVRPLPDLSFIPDEESDAEDDDSMQTAVMSPVVPPSFYDWAAGKTLIETHKYILSENIFTRYEISRKVHLMFCLNVLGTLQRGFYSRNEMVVPLLDNLSDDYPNKDDHVASIEEACGFLNGLGIEKDSYWTNKTNAYSLVVLLANNRDKISSINKSNAIDGLKRFERDLPDDYRIAAKEAVNNKRERMLRNDYLEKIFFGEVIGKLFST